MVGTLAIVLGLAIAITHNPGTDFYATSAQIIPVFLLVAVVEGRYFQSRRDDGTYARTLLITLLCAPLIAEVAALAALAGVEGRVIRAIVITGAAVTPIPLLIFALYGPRIISPESAGTPLHVSPPPDEAVRVAASGPTETSNGAFVEADLDGIPLGGPQEDPPDTDVSPFAADEPIEDPSADRLDRAGLATLLARNAVRAPSSGGFVIALTGEWGSGKTSVLNMAAGEIRKLGGAIPVSFNPWFFADSGQLLPRFFEQLAIELRANGHPDLQRALARYGSALQSPSQRTSMLEELASALGARPTPAGPRSIDDLREVVSRELRRLPTRIVVTLDDVDRLSAEETREVMRLVKLVGDLPKLTYIVAFDSARIEEALDEGLPGGGRDYLQKIIQVEYRVPPAARLRILQITFSDLDRVLEPLDHRDLDEHRWGNLVHAGLGAFIRNLRHGKLYVNAVPTIVELVGQEIDLVDLLGLEALRIFEPNVHLRLGAHTDLLCSGGGDAFGGRNEEAERAEMDSLLNRATDRVAAQGVLAQLFPAAGHLLGASRHVPVRSWRSERRVADSEILQLYLETVLSEDQLSAALVERAIGELTDSARLVQTLKSLSDSRLASLIRELGDQAPDLPVAPAQVVAALLDTEQRFPDDRQMFEVPTRFSLHRLVHFLTLKVPEADRDAFAEEVFAEAESRSARMRFLNWIGTFPHVADRKPEEQLLSAAMTQRLEEALVRDVLAASGDDLAREPFLARLLWVAHQEDESRRRQHVNRVAEASPAFLLALIRQYFQYQLAATLGDHVSRRIPRLDWPALVKATGDNWLRDRLVTHQGELEALSDDPRTDAALALALEYATGQRDPAREEA